MSKSASKTPAPLVDRIRGSKKNKAGSAESKKSAQGIKLNASIIAGLTKKAKEYNEKHPKNKVSVTTLKAVMRRGMGAYSTSHRPTITGGAPNTRQAWAYARVNAFLRKKGGQGAKPTYVQDNDLLAHGGQLGKEITCVNCGWHWNTNDSDPSDKYVCHKCGYDNRTYYDSEPIGKMADGALLYNPKNIQVGDYVEYNKWYYNWVYTIRGEVLEIIDSGNYNNINQKIAKAKILIDKKFGQTGALPHQKTTIIDVSKLSKIDKMADGGVVPNEVKENPIYKLLLQKSKETYFTKDKVRMPQISKIGEFLDSIGVSTNGTYQNGNLKIGRQQKQNPNGHVDTFYWLNINSNNTSYTRNSPIYAKKIIDYIDEFYKKGKMAHGGLTKSLAIADIHKKYPELPKKYINAQLYIGMKFEMEHTENPDVAKKIALDHLNESPFYYEYLTKMEKQLEGLDVKKHYQEVKGYAKGGEINPDNKSVKDYFAHGSGNVGGVLVGKRHSEGGIKAVNKSTNQPLEMEGGEVVITRNAVSDTEKREFEGEMLTNREILSRINESGGGVSFADGGDIPETINTSGKEYAYGGKMVKDHDIVSSCGCKHTMAEGGKLATEEFNEMYGTNLKSGGQLYGQGGVLRIINKEVPTYLAFQELFNGLKVPDLRKEYEGFLKENYKINFMELPQKVRTGLLLGSQKLIDNYINK